MPASETHIRKKVRRERESFLEQIESFLEPIMLFFSFVWLVLVVVELSAGLSPLLENVTMALWTAFLIDFLLKLIIAPDRWLYLRNNLLVVLSLLLPALRLARFVAVFRLAATAKGVRLVKILTTANRGMRALRRTFRQQRVSYVVLLTLAVTFLGAAGMRAFEPESLRSYPEALWWTSMIMTTMGSDYWPRSPEGRLLCFLLALYAFTMFGYVTATLASLFLGKDRSSRGDAGIRKEAPRR